MDKEIEKTNQYVYARIAGLSYVIFTIAGLIKNFLLNTKLSDVSTISTNGIFANEIHFRLGIAAETIMFLAVVTASVSFYVVFKSVHKQLSQMALCFRLVEIIVGGMAVVFSIAMLALSSKTFLLDIFSLEKIRTIVAIASSFRVPSYEYSWIFMGFAGVITFYLFYQTRFIPRAWSIWGIFTYTSLILYPFAKILIPDLPREVMFIMFPGALFELGVGLWLITKGINRPVNSSHSINDTSVNTNN